MPNSAHTAVEDRAHGTQDIVQCLRGAIQVWKAASGVPTCGISHLRGVEAFPFAQKGAGNEARARVADSADGRAWGAAAAVHARGNTVAGEDEQPEGGGSEELEWGAREIGVWRWVWIEEFGDNAEEFLEADGDASAWEA